MTHGDAPLLQIAKPVRPSPVARHAGGAKVVLMKPPFFTPWTPPLGIAILKSYLAEAGYDVRCVDFNVDPVLWQTHHDYFQAVQSLEPVSTNDGYSKLWWILNAHMLAFANGGTRRQCAHVLRSVIPLYAVPLDDAVLERLLDIVEAFYRRLAQAVDEIDLTGYRCVGTSTYTTSLGPSLFILQRMKARAPQVTTVMGGGVFADDLAVGSDNLATLLSDYPFVDHVVVGEGEILFKGLLDGELAGKRLISIADINQTTLEMKDVPVPDFSDFEMDRYYHLTIEGARSCPFQCSFCSETVQWGKYRVKPMDQFAAQVLALAQSCKRASYFMGDSLMNPYIPRFAPELLKQGSTVQYDGYLRADKPVADHARTRLWAKSGLYRARLGIESASAGVLDAMHKMTTPATIAEAIRSLASAGIRTTTYWIVGFPGETRDQFEETLDFIREHHHYIYELEAHPYYYYPYGQIGSRLHQCRSLYPDDVTDIIRFKVWDVLNVTPSREERYERLRTITQVSASLGLPNIYSMHERYAAEERWLRLQPLAVDVYEGARRPRIVPPAPAVDVAIANTAGHAPMPETPREPQAEVDTQAEAWCARLRALEPLDLPMLRSAIAALVDGNERLRPDASHGHAAGDASHGDAGGPDARADAMLSAPIAVAEEAREAACRTEAARLTEAVRSAPGAALRVAVVHVEAAPSDILVAVHRDVTDPAGLGLLCEDLARAYLQLVQGQSVSLLPVDTPYAEAEAAATRHGRGRDRPVRTPAARQASPRTHTIIPLDLSHGAWRSSLAGYGLTLGECVAASLLRAWPDDAAAPRIAWDVQVDARTAYPAWSRTVGPLAVSRPLPAARLEPRSAPLDVWLPSLRHHLQLSTALAPSDAAVDGTPSNDEGQAPAWRGLLDLSGLSFDPWLSGGAWTTHGLVSPALACDDQACALTVGAALTLPGSIQVHVWTDERSPLAPVVQALAEELPAAFAAILEHARRYTAAKPFWEGELRRGPNDTLLAMPAIVRRSTQQARLSVELDAEAMASLSAQAGVEAAAALSATFAVLLGRWQGESRIPLLVRDAPHPLPLMMTVPWNASWRTFVQGCDRKLREAARHGPFAAELVDRYLAADAAGTPSLAAHGPYACDWHPEAGAPRGDADGWLVHARLRAMNGTCALDLAYDVEQVGADIAAMLAASWSAIVAEAADGIDRPITERGAADEAVSGADAVEQFARDAFAL
jgi:hypothetical protein